ncbi:unnamed protein product [Paramecium pentaurelia]|uniref:Uncharacterized protein n=1 Tax=Paramecium pentaurelia TaxID=43138 RepID=A0A8S1S7Q9_9CILI|nr:unnamed protein product [Paramecium pentaurelia]
MNMNPEEIYLNQLYEQQQIKFLYLKNRNLSEYSIKSLKIILLSKNNHLERSNKNYLITVILQCHFFKRNQIITRQYNFISQFLIFNLLLLRRFLIQMFKSLDQQVFNINDCFYYKMLQQQFYYDVFKIVQQMSANQIITTNEKENLKNIIINHDSKFVQTLDTIYKSEENEKSEKIIAEIKLYIKSIRQRKPKYLKNKQMRVITDETEKYIYDDIIAEVSSDSDSIS